MGEALLSEQNSQGHPSISASQVSSREYLSAEDIEHDPGLFSKLFSWVRWNKTSHKAMEKAELGLLGLLRTTFDAFFVTIPNERRIRTLAANEIPANSHRVPLVLVHGMGAGLALWLLNLDSLADNRVVYCFDLLGFGRSSRPKFSHEPEEAIQEFVQSIEQWRESMNVPNFVLCGHSFGGYLSYYYAIRYPHRVRHLILADPWGFAEEPDHVSSHITIPMWVRVVGSFMVRFSPFAGMRFAGPWGTNLIQRVRPDLGRKFGSSSTTVYDYIYHCNAQSPSGELAFMHLVHGFGWAKIPVVQKASELDASVGITFIYGSRSWLDKSVGYQVKNIRTNSFVDVKVIRGAGHHIYADKAGDFNELINEICASVDSAEGEEEVATAKSEQDTGDDGQISNS